MENHPQVEQVEETAAAWLLRRDSAQWSAVEQAQLEAWLQASPSHMVSFIRLRSVWNKSGRLSVVSAESDGGFAPSRGTIKQLSFFRKSQEMTRSVITPKQRHAVAVSYRVAAAVFVIIASAVSVVLWWSPPGTSLQTPVGGLTTMPMEDGSRVTLNTDTEIRIDVDEQERRVSLARGEAFFDVAKDFSRPFVVYAASKRIVAVGTQFSVRMDGDELRVLVTEGRVRVEDESSRGRRTLTQLDAGGVASMLSVGGNAVEVQQQPLEFVERSLSWRMGFIVLRGSSLADAVAEFNRYNTHQLIIGDTSLADVSVGGSFKPNNIEGFIRLLQQGFPISAEQSEHSTILTRRSDEP